MRKQVVSSSFNNFQLLSRCRRRPSGVRHREALDLRERRALAARVARPRRCQHRDHARRKQVRLETPACGPHRGGARLR